MGSFNIPGDAALSSDGRTLTQVVGPGAFAQRLRIGIRTVLGTYKYDMAVGVPWIEMLDKPSQALLRAGLHDYFLGHKQVSSILSLDFTIAQLTRLMTVTYVLLMADGTTVSSSSDITPLAVPT